MNATRPRNGHSRVHSRVRSQNGIACYGASARPTTKARMRVSILLGQGHLDRRFIFGKKAKQVTKILRRIFFYELSSRGCHVRQDDLSRATLVLGRFDEPDKSCKIGIAVPSIGGEDIAIGGDFAEERFCDVPITSVMRGLDDSKVRAAGPRQRSLRQAELPCWCLPCRRSGHRPQERPKSYSAAPGLIWPKRCQFPERPSPA